MSTGDEPAATGFDAWIGEEFARGPGEGFTALIVLVRIKGTKVTPAASTYAHVIGTDLDWGAMTGLLAGARKRWDAVAFFPRRDPRRGGPLDDRTARLYLMDVEARLDDDRLVLNEGRFFDAWGRAMRIDEVEA